MTWIPKYNTSFVEPLVNNLLAWIRTSQTGAFLWAGATSGNFVSIYNSRIGLNGNDFPDLMVDRIITNLDESDDCGEVRELIKITLIFELKGADATSLTVQQWRYMRALDSMIRSIPPLTLMAGVAGTQHGASEVVNHDYGVLRTIESQYIRQGALTVAIAISEDRNNNA